MDDRTIGIDPQRDLAKLLRIFKPRLGNDRRVQLLAFQRWRTAQLAGGNLIVLNLQRIDDVHRRQVVFVQQVAIQPDAHGVLRAEQLYIAHTVESADGIFNIRGDIVGNIIRVVTGLSEIKPATSRKLLLDFSTLIPCCWTS